MAVYGWCTLFEADCVTNPKGRSPLLNNFLSNCNEHALTYAGLEHGAGIGARAAGGVVLLRMNRQNNCAQAKREEGKEKALHWVSFIAKLKGARADQLIWGMSLFARHFRKSC
jgi:hypothetical protein